VSFAYIVHLANYSDGVLYVLAFLLLVATAVTLDRLWCLRRAILRGNALVHRMASMGRVTAGDLEELRNLAGRQPEAVLLDTALQHAGAASSEALGNRMDEAIMVIAPRLDRRLWILDTVITLAPLMGLFGTIIGMFHAFSVLAKPGHAPAEVTGGVADALVATALGILIAMLGLATFNLLSNQVRLILHQLETLKTMVLNRTDGAPVIPLMRQQTTTSRLVPAE
jgi:biopolymer transport protein ExbB